MPLTSQQVTAVLDALAARRPFAMIKGWLAAQGVHVRNKAELHYLLYQFQGRSR